MKQGDLAFCLFSFLSVLVFRESGLEQLQETSYLDLTS
jgi:hypothetical protein